MKKLNALLMLLGGAAVLGGCASSGPPRPGAPGPLFVTPLMLEPPPVYSLLGFRDKLDLTNRQIASLDSIATWVHDINSALSDSLVRGAQQTRNGAAVVVTDTVGRSLLRQIRANNHAAAAGVGQVLSESQQKTACDIFNDQSPRDRERQRRAMADRMRSDRQMDDDERMAEVDSLMARFSVWPFCRNDTTAASTTRK
ncbi:MAG TPA: hypothetical protein VFL93_15655 [Longimicrobiaceae bacterium]|nr:hypothetical protein [Longimicrobiaceae bacterium]